MLQYLAAQSSRASAFEALESQANVLTRSGYISDLFSAMVHSGCVCVVETLRLRQAGLLGPVGFMKSYWRNRCRRASNSSQWSPLSALLQPVTTLRKKSSSWLRPNRSRPSRRTPANTSKISAGPAFRSVPSAPPSAAWHPLPEVHTC